MTGLTLALLLWARWQLPDFAGQAAQQRLGLRQVVRGCAVFVRCFG